jgi:hypothetical protein
VKNVPNCLPLVSGSTANASSRRSEALATACWSVARNRPQPETHRVSHSGALWPLKSRQISRKDRPASFSLASICSAASRSNSSSAGVKIPGRLPVASLISVLCLREPKKELQPSLAMTLAMSRSPRYPTLPSRLTPSSFCASTANSIGRFKNTCLQKPFTIMLTASSVDRPRCLQ